ncbi:uncharacterized protein [Gossypium hirsutum]|uniref:Uncharacterized protein n=1 Tax=Gossypium hirsutum TaxID=3635 RepID=A0A1U8HND4_GOSHI|nr:uncharacterized protein LOC107887827 [Gossypium hirsutum]
MAPYKALYGHKCRTSLCWTELGECRVLGPEMVSETEDKVRLIRDCLKVDSDGQNSYAELKRSEIEYSVRASFFIRSRHGRRPIHDVFHVSMLRHYRSGPTYIVPDEEIDVRPALTFKEEPIQFLDRDVKVIWKKSILLVNVLW